MSPECLIVSTLGSVIDPECLIVSCLLQGEFREDNFNTAMQVLRDTGDSGGSSGGGKWDTKGRKGGTRGV